MWLPHDRATFDTDNIDIGPERRNYLDHRLSRVWEMNSEVGDPCDGHAPRYGGACECRSPACAVL